MKKISLTNENSNAIHVDDVKVEDGVYFMWNSGEKHFVLPYKGGYTTYNLRNGERSNSKEWQSLTELVENCPYDSAYYHIKTGKQITTEKELTIEDLTNDMHVGFVTQNYGKYHVIPFGFGSINAVGIQCVDIYRSKPVSSIKELLLSSVTELYIFDTRKELYKWLSE